MRTPDPAAQLAADYEETIARKAALTRDLEQVIEASAGANADDEHDPEGATIGFERAQISALVDQARHHLLELDRAMDRLRDGTYEVCEQCGRPIAPARLKARPTAATCVACASARP